MATAQTDINGRELISRMSLLAADPEERFGSKSPRSSPPSYASSEATELATDPRPDPVPWDKVRKQHEEWMASVDSMTGSMEDFKPIAEHMRKQREKEEQDFTRRTGVTTVRKTTLISYDLDSIFTQPARSAPKQASADVDKILAKPRLPLRRSARIAQIRREENSIAHQKASQPSRKESAPRIPRDRSAERRALKENISRRKIAKKRGRPPTRRSQQEENPQGGSTKRRGRPRKILQTAEEAIAKKTRKLQKIA